MIIIDPATNRPEVRSDCQTAWNRIYGGQNFKKLKEKDRKKLSGFVSKLTWRKAPNAATVARKAATQAKIDRMLRAKRRYELLVENPECKVKTCKDGNFIQPRGEKGKFKARIFI